MMSQWSQDAVALSRPFAVRAANSRQARSTHQREYASHNASTCRSRIHPFLPKSLSKYLPSAIDRHQTLSILTAILSIRHITDVFGTITKCALLVQKRAQKTSAVKFAKYSFEDRPVLVFWFCMRSQIFIMFMH